LIREWAQELAKPTKFNNGVSSCPFALPAIDAGEVSTMSSSNLWLDVLSESLGFDLLDQKVLMIFAPGYDGGYEELESRCMALNDVFAASGIDIWLLSYMHDDVIVFVQRWSELEKAAAKLEKLGYYQNYEPDDYERHILARRKRSA